MTTALETTSALGLPRTPVGIAGFDELSNGGLTTGRTTVLVGTAGSGKTVFAAQFLVEGIRRFGEHGVLATFEETPDDVARNVATLGWDLPGLAAEDRLALVDGSLAPGDEIVTMGDYNFDALIVRVEAAVRRVGARRVVMDALGALLPLFADPAIVRREIRRVVAAFREMGVTTLITIERREEYGPVARFEVEDFVADNVVVLRNPLDREKRRRTVEILKMRGCAHHKGEYPLTIDPRTGVNVIPLSAIELRKTAPPERISTGNEGIDQICGGGLHRDAAILITGATGTGKTLMASQFVAAAAARGERGLYVSFEEAPGQLIRNAASWGIDLQGAVDAGLVKIIAQSPERMGLEDLLVQLSVESDSFRPTRVVIDSLTALEHTSTARTFREFVVGLVSYLKAHDIAALLTKTTSMLAQVESFSETHLSTMADAILVLRYVEIEGDMRRAMVLLKMRGSAHDTQIHEYRIDSQGMRVGAPLRGMSGIMGGTQLYANYGRGSEGSPVGDDRGDA